MSDTTLSTAPATPHPRGWRADLAAPLVAGLAALLALQLLLTLILALGVGGARVTPATASGPLLDFTPERIQSLRLQGGDGTSGVVLERTADGWILPDSGGLPAMRPHVEQLLDTLAELTLPLPLATSAEARERFRVADDAFERRLTLRDDQGREATLLAGTSPGFRRLFVRPAGDAGVYDLRLALTDLSANPDDWLDQGLLRVEPERLRRLATDDWTLAAGDAGWTLEAGVWPEDAPELTDTLIRQLATLRVRGARPDARVPDAPPKLALRLELDGEDPREYRIFAGAHADDYLLFASAHPLGFAVSRFELMDWEPLLQRAPPVAPAP